MKITSSVVGLAVGRDSSTRHSVAQETDRRWVVELAEGARVDDLAKLLHIRPRHIQLIIVNGQCAGPGTILHDGDAVAFTGQIAGD